MFDPDVILPRLVRIALIIVIARLAVGVARSAMGKVLGLKYRMPVGRGHGKGVDKREATLIALAQSSVTYIGYFVAILMILTELRLDVKGLLAGAGIVGIAVGFGAQNLVKDIIAGFFIVLERQFSVGDNVGILGHRGTVEEIGLRTTKVKAWTGERFTIPNGRIEEVTNYSVHNSMAVVDVVVASDEDPGNAMGVVGAVAVEACRDIDGVAGVPEVLGIEGINEYRMVVRVAVETEPMQHIRVERVLRRRIREGMTERGIRLPEPRIALAGRGERG